MLSQQQRDADGRAAQSGINAHCRALHTRGREEKHHQSKRGRSLADNEKPCSVFVRWKTRGSEGGKKNKKGNGAEETFWRRCDKGMGPLHYCKKISG